MPILLHCFVFENVNFDPVTAELLSAISMLQKTESASDNDDDVAIFLKSMAVKLNRLTPENQLIFQQEMLMKYSELSRSQTAPFYPPSAPIPSASTAFSSATSHVHSAPSPARTTLSHQQSHNYNYHYHTPPRYTDPPRPDQHTSSPSSHTYTNL